MTRNNVEKTNTEQKKKNNNYANENHIHRTGNDSVETQGKRNTYDNHHSGPHFNITEQTILHFIG